jgi:hypothetical protein
MIDFKHLESEKNTKNKMILFVNLLPQRFISDSIYIKIDERIFPLKAQKILKTPVKESETEVKTEVKKSKNQDEKDTEKEMLVSTTQTTNSYELTHTSLFFEFPEQIIKTLKNSGMFSLRFYVDDQPYTIKIKGHKLDNIKKVFNFENQTSNK